LYSQYAPFYFLNLRYPTIYGYFIIGTPGTEGSTIMDHVTAGKTWEANLPALSKYPHFHLEGADSEPMRCNLVEIVNEAGRPLEGDNLKVMSIPNGNC
jgi:hypothetical protein